MKIIALIQFWVDSLTLIISVIKIYEEWLPQIFKKEF